MFRPVSAAHRLARPAAAALALWLLAGAATADTWTDKHDEPAPVWDIDPADGARLLERKRIRLPSGGGKTESGGEWLSYAAPVGYSATAWRPTPPAAVIAELAIEADVRFRQPGLLMAAEVVLPHTATADDPPVRLRVRSDLNDSNLAKNGPARLDRLPLRIERRARVWALEHGGKRLDTRGAYVERVGLVLPGAGRPAEVVVDELRIESLVTPLRLATARAETGESGPQLTAPTGAGQVTPTRITLRSDGFRIDGRAYFPRLWRWRGEPFEALSARGINVVWLDAVATPQELAEAAHHRLRVVCPPPESVAAAAAGNWDRVLAWVAPRPVNAGLLDSALVEVDRVRQFPDAAQRPYLAEVEGAAEAWSRVADGLLIASRPEGLRHATPPGIAVVGVASLELGSQATAQLDALLGEGVAATWRPPGFVANTVEAALRHGVVGVAFTAESSLSGADDATYAAAGWLETLNRRLRLIEPWIVGPRSLQAASPANTTVFARGATRLAAVAPLSGESASPQSLQDAPALTGAYRLTPAGLSDWNSARSATGPAVLLPGVDAPGDLLLTSDPRLVRSLRGYVAETGPAAARTAGHVAETTLRLCESLPPEDRRRAEQRLAAWRLASSRRDHRTAYDEALSCLAVCAVADAQRLHLAVDGAAAESSPLALLPTTLTDHFRLAQLLAASPRGANRLYGGSFEDIDASRREGWRRPPEEDDRAAGPSGAELVEADAVHGERVLRLTGRAAARPAIESPPIDLQAGESIEVTGWARVASPGDGRLVVSDSLGGEELALAIGPTDGRWRPFRLLRATQAQTAISVAFTTRGDVTAEVDAVMLRPIQTPGMASRAGLLK